CTGPQSGCGASASLVEQVLGQQGDRTAGRTLVLATAGPGGSGDIHMRPAIGLGETRQEAGGGDGAGPGPPMLAMSAKGLSSCSWYSSNSGSCQPRSSAWRPASSSCATSVSSLPMMPVVCAPRATTQAPVRVAISTTLAGLKRSA